MRKKGAVLMRVIAIKKALGKGEELEGGNGERSTKGRKRGKKDFPTVASAANGVHRCRATAAPPS